MDDGVVHPLAVVNSPTPMGYAEDTIVPAPRTEENSAGDPDRGPESEAERRRAQRRQRLLNLSSQLG